MNGLQQSFVSQLVCDFISLEVCVCNQERTQAGHQPTIQPVFLYFQANLIYVCDERRSYLAANLTALYHSHLSFFLHLRNWIIAPDQKDNFKMYTWTSTLTMDLNFRPNIWTMICYYTNNLANDSKITLHSIC